MVEVHLGLDESNHGREPEVVAGVFSTNPEDALCFENSGRKKLTVKAPVLKEYLELRGIAGKFIAIPKRDLIETVHPLVQAAPYLLRSYIGRGYMEIFLNILMDGEVRKLDGLIKTIEEEFPNVRVTGVRAFPKCARSAGTYKYAGILRFADSLAYFARDYCERRSINLGEVYDAKVLFDSKERSALRSRRHEHGVKSR